MSVIEDGKKTRRKRVWLKEEVREWSSDKGAIWTLSECSKTDPKAVEFIRVEKTA